MVSTKDTQSPKTCGRYHHGKKHGILPEAIVAVHRRQTNKLTRTIKTQPPCQETPAKPGDRRIGASGDGDATPSGQTQGVGGVATNFPFELRYATQARIRVVRDKSSRASLAVGNFALASSAKLQTGPKETRRGGWQPEKGKLQREEKNPCSSRPRRSPAPGPHPSSTAMTRSPRTGERRGIVAGTVL